MWRRSATDKPRYRGKVAREPRPLGSFSGWKLHRGSKRFKAW